MVVEKTFVEILGITVSFMISDYRFSLIGWQGSFEDTIHKCLLQFNQIDVLLIMWVVVDIHHFIDVLYLRIGFYITAPLVPCVIFPLMKESRVALDSFSERIS